MATRLAVLSDIHGNLPALEAVISDLARESIDQVLVAGDTINCGPYSVAVLERIAALGWPIIRGNHEFYLLDYNTPREPESRRHFTMPRWLNITIPQRWQTYLATLPDGLTLYFPDAEPIQLAHGIPGNPWVGIRPLGPDSVVAKQLADTAESTVVVGHTHLPMDRWVRAGSRQWHVINPGSVGLPLHGTVDAAYAILESQPDGTWQATLRHTAYDHSPLFAEFERIDFIGGCGVVGRLLIEEFRTGNYRIMPFQRWMARYHPNQPESFALAEAFLQQDEAAIFECVDETYKIERGYYLRLAEDNA